MRFFHAEHLFAQRKNIGAVRIERRGRQVVAVVNRIHPSQRIPPRKDLIESHRSKIFANRLQRTAEYLRDAIEVGRIRRRDRPQIQQRLNTGHGSRPRSRIRNECRRSLMQMLAQSLVVAEEEGLVLRSGPPSDPPNWFRWKAAARTLIEIIRCIQRIISQKLIHAAVQLIRPRLRSR